MKHPKQLSRPRAISIEIEFDNGTISYAEGDDAALISGEVMTAIHGFRYEGPFLKTKKRGKSK